VTLQEADAVLNRRPEGFEPTELKALVAKIKKIVILKTSWYLEVINEMEASALKFLQSAEIPASVIESRRIPGSFELPLAALQVLPADFIIALGCVVKGDTPHFDFVCQALTQGLMTVQINSKTPIGFGVLTVSNLHQAEIRGSKGAEAAQAAFLMYLHGAKSASKKVG